MTTFTIKDETVTGDILNELRIKVANERITIKDIITARVESEVESYNNKLPEYFKGLIQPSEAEKTLNGFKIKDKKKIDVEKQVFVALDAFQKNGYFVLVDNQQAETLEEEVLLSKTTTVSFVKLTPLVGG
ncbi:hypothetical protein [Aquimarina sediminis]|uniref:hypothetical protein n=1 Tax=Aquimarina sediminis TaxID=2070536 RepID=UPI000CA05F3B|nr:hypothetical protein [Aquimarina sediminis]